ncbi:hypothetical protein ONZ45_g17335 [Pleurotus djamor]|nr:hypothetical protein ONZ45_g17335 [Pleurotus djamor]
MDRGIGYPQGYWVRVLKGMGVFVGNLAYATTDEGLKTFFAPVQNDIVSAHVILRGHRSAGYGFVALSNADAMHKAAELLNKKELDGREVVVEVAKPSDQKERKERKTKKRPSRRGDKAVPGEVTDAEANGEAPKPEAPAAEGVDGQPKPKKKKKTNRKSKAPKANGEVSDAPAAETAEDAAPQAAKKPAKARKPRPPRVPRAEGEDPAGELSKTMLFVANLGFTVEDSDLETLFTEAGIHVVSARIVRRRYGKPRKSKGYGFVDVGSEEEQKKAIAALDNKEVSGRPIAVKIAVNTAQEDSEPEAKATDVATDAAPTVSTPVPAAAPAPAAPVVAAA